MVFVTPIVFVVRAGPDMNKFGDPYNFSCTVTLVQDIAYVQAASGELPKASEVREFIRSMYKIGAKKVVWERATGKHVEHKQE